MSVKRTKETETQTTSSHKVSFSESMEVENENNHTLDSTFLGSDRRRSSRLFSLNRQGLIRVEFYSGGPDVEKMDCSF